VHEIVHEQEPKQAKLRSAKFGIFVCLQPDAKPSAIESIVVPVAVGSNRHGGVPRRLP
jgi:hypothetical protein